MKQKITKPFHPMNFKSNFFAFQIFWMMICLCFLWRFSVFRYDLNEMETKAFQIVPSWQVQILESGTCLETYSVSFWVFVAFLKVLGLESRVNWFLNYFFVFRTIFGFWKGIEEGPEGHLIPTSIWPHLESSLNYHVHLRCHCLKNCFHDFHSCNKQDWKFQSIARDNIVKIGQDWKLGKI